MCTHRSASRDEAGPAFDTLPSVAASHRLVSRVLARREGRVPYFRIMALPMFAREKEDVAAALSVDPLRGLVAGEAVRRSVHFGRNIIHARGRLWGVMALAAFIAAGAFAAREGLAPIAISVLVIAAASAGVVRFLHPPRRAIARVLCDGAEVLVKAADLVPGDVIVVDPGTDVPADARVVMAAALNVDESELTGARTPVAKSPDAVAPDAPLAERRSMLYRGTHVVTGHATAIVTATGDRTELGMSARTVSPIASYRHSPPSRPHHAAS